MIEDYLTRGEKEFLLKIARSTLEKFVTEREVYEPQTVNSKLWEKRGVFVTLTKNGELRGCVGQTEPVEPLILAIRDNAIASAKDSRFDNIERAELREINIEVSILSELERTTLEAIAIGDGVVIKKGSQGATYLPQVWDDFAKATSPKEDLSSKDEFLKSLCLKADLEENSYLDEDIELYKYSAIKFNE